MGCDLPEAAVFDREREIARELDGCLHSLEGFVASKAEAGRIDWEDDAPVFWGIIDEARDALRRADQAGVGGPIGGEGEQDWGGSPVLWVLYDSDGDQVIGGAVYRDRDEAVANAGELDDVVVVPILVP